MLKKLLQLGIDTIGMVKQLKQRYIYKEQTYTLPQLRRFVRSEDNKTIFGSVHVTTKTGIPIKIVIIRNRNKKSECLYLISTDCSLSNAEIVRIYGNRWSTECFYKAALFFTFCEDIQDMDLENALKSLMALFMEHISTFAVDITTCIKSKVDDWIDSQATFIQDLFVKICWESWVYK